MDNNYNNGYDNDQQNNYDSQGYDQQNYDRQYGSQGNGQQGYGPQGYGSWNNEPKRKSPMGVTSMILGIVSLVLSCCCNYLILFIAVAAVILGIVSLRKGESSKALAYTGIITGILGIAFAIVWVMAVIYMRQTGLYDQILNDFYGQYNIPEQFR